MLCCWGMSWCLDLQPGHSQKNTIISSKPKQNIWVWLQKTHGTWVYGWFTLLPMLFRNLAMFAPGWAQLNHLQTNQPTLFFSTTQTPKRPKRPNKRLPAGGLLRAQSRQGFCGLVTWKPRLNKIKKNEYSNQTHSLPLQYCSKYVPFLQRHLFYFL